MIQVPKSRTSIQKVRVRSELQIPANCDAEAIYKRLKHNLEASYNAAPWFQVKFQGLGTQLWTLDARLNIGATNLHASLRTKIRTLILQSFKDHLSQDQFETLQKSFSGITKMLQIDEDGTTFSDMSLHSWTCNGLPDMEDFDVDSLFRDCPARAATFSKAAANYGPLEDGFPATAALVPASAPPPFVRATSPPVVGGRRPRDPPTPPSQNRPGLAVSANKTASKTARTSTAAGAALRGLQFEASGGQPPPTCTPPSAGAAVGAPRDGDLPGRPPPVPAVGGPESAAAGAGAPLAATVAPAAGAAGTARPAPRAAVGGPAPSTTAPHPVRTLLGASAGTWAGTTARPATAGAGAPAPAGAGAATTAPARPATAGAGGPARAGMTGPTARQALLPVQAAGAVTTAPARPATAGAGAITRQIVPAPALAGMTGPTARQVLLPVQAAGAATTAPARPATAGAGAPARAVMIGPTAR